MPIFHLHTQCFEITYEDELYETITKTCDNYWAKVYHTHLNHTRFLICLRGCIFSILKVKIFININIVLIIVHMPGTFFIL